MTDEEKRDQVLKRMLNTKPKPRKEKPDYSGQQRTDTHKKRDKISQ